MDATVEVKAVEDVGTNTVAITFESPDGFDAQPGQFVKLSGTVDGENYARFYTLSSATVDDTFEVTVGIDPEESGPFSEHLVGLAAGETLEMSGPFGSDYYEGEARVVVVAGGPGIGAAVGIGERAIDDGREVAVIYRDDDPAHEDRLTKLNAAGAAVAIVDGDIASTVEETLTGDEDEQVFVYGFADFVAEAEAAIEAAGGDPDAAKVENFG
ncbi:FAD-dependent oxidoreductase [Haloferacaceae archaeon DSL9]